VRDQLHIPAALPPGKSPYPEYEEAAWAKNGCVRNAEKSPATVDNLNLVLQFIATYAGLIMTALSQVGKFINKKILVYE